jgi:hypothetical protein
MDAISTAGLISRPVDSDQDGEKCGVAAGITACEERRRADLQGKTPLDPFFTIGEPDRSRIASDSAIFGSFIGVLPPPVLGQRRTIADKDYTIVLASLR